MFAIWLAFLDPPAISEAESDLKVDKLRNKASTISDPIEQSKKKNRLLMWNKLILYF